MFAITVTGITVNTLIAPSISEILDGLGVSTSLSGVLVGSATLPGVVLAPVIGVLADRYGRRELLVPCLLVFAVAGGLAGFAPSIWWLAAARFVQGAGSAGLINLAVVIIGDHWHGNRRAQIIGWNAAVLTASLALLPTLGGGLTDVAGWRAPFAVYPLAAATALYAWRVLPPGERHPETFGQQLRATLPLLRRMPIVLTIISAALTFALIFGLLLTVLPLYLADAFNLSAAQRGVILGLPALANGAVALSLGAIRRRAARRHLLVAASAFFAMGLMAIAASSVLAGLIAGLVVFGLGEGLMVPNLQDIATSTAPSAQRGTSVALFVSGARLGQTLGPLAAGAAFAAVGGPATFLGGALIALLLSVALGAFLQRAQAGDV